jgi:hypothetical protein
MATSFPAFGAESKAALSTALVALHGFVPRTLSSANCGYCKTGAGLLFLGAFQSWLGMVDCPPKLWNPLHPINHKGHVSPIAGQRWIA